jgi:hypothetical protein
VIRGKGDYIIANTAHEIMSAISPSVFLERWQSDVSEINQLSANIMKDSWDLIDETMSSSRDYRMSRGWSIPENFEDETKTRVNSLVVGFIKRIMRKYECPRRILTEVTITNVRNFHEGRLDAILEFDNGTYGQVDWKTYDDSGVSTNSYDKWQLCANMLLLNYRYTGNEDSWEKCRFGAVVYLGSAYFPTMPLTNEVIQKVKADREYAHNVLCNKSAPTRKPAFCPVCDTGASGSEACKFYREDSKLRFEGKVPENYNRISRLLMRRRYVTIDERSITHRHKFAVQIMIDKMSEEVALKELEDRGIVQSGYRLDSVEDKLLILRRPEGSTFLESGKPLRVIGKEPSIPLLACVNVIGSLKEASGDKTVIELFNSVSARRARQQLSGLPIVIMPDVINLTRRILGPLDKFHRLIAADILIPKEPFDFGDQS